LFPTADAACRIAKPDLNDRCMRLLGQRETLAPEEKVGIVEQSASSRHAALAAIFPRVRRSFLSANVYLRPASVISF
jgi:hypothetical protein